MTNKIAIVAPNKIFEAIESSKNDDWDLQFPITSLNDFDRELDDDYSELDKNTPVVIFFSRLFDSNPEKFAELVSYLAPNALVNILIPSKDVATSRDKIEREIKDFQIELAKEDDGYNANTPFFFVEYEQFFADFYSAVERYVSSPIIDHETKKAVKLFLPESEVDDYVEEDDVDEFESVNQEIKLPKPPANAKGTVIAVTSAKGGSGKSTVSISLANYLAISTNLAFRNGTSMESKSVCVVDLDVRDGQLGFLNFAPKTAPNILEIIAKGTPTVESIRSGIWSNMKSGVDYIFASKRPRNAKNVASSSYAEIIQLLRSMYDYVILDTSVNYLDPLLEDVAYPLADKIIFVTDMGISSIYGMVRWVNETVKSEERKEVALDGSKIGIVVNKALKDVNMSPERISSASGDMPILSVVPSMPRLVTYYANTGELHEILKQKPINEAVKFIAEAIIDDDTILADIPTEK